MLKKKKRRKETFVTVRSLLEQMAREGRKLDQRIVAVYSTILWG
jgi:hypothetical protein